MTRLALGESRSLAVDPRECYMPTEVTVAPGERYGFTATGQWRDWYKTCGPEGWGGGWLTRFSRLPGQPFFRLCATLGKDDDTAFAVDTTQPWTAPPGVPADSQIYLFANDLRGMYWNNRTVPDHPLTVTITRLP